MDKIRVDINRHYQEVMQTDGFVTADKVKNAYLGLGVKQDTFLSLFAKHNQDFLKKVGYNRAEARENNRLSGNKFWRFGGGCKPFVYFCMMLTTRQKIKAAIHWGENKNPYLCC